jgi:hypothetical protein
MTLLEWISTWRNRATPVSGPERTLFPTHPPVVAPVSAEWLSLFTYLDRRYASTVVLTFAQVETLLGRALPEAARTEQGWWTDGPSLVSRWSNAWTAARRTATPNLLARTVAFERLP